jgi:prepilin-type N-terminal cleavage/methylation domain-containing protein
MSINAAQFRRRNYSLPRYSGGGLGRGLYSRRNPLPGPPREYRGRGERRAFTLVEILAVVVIIGIASAIIIPEIGSRDDMKAAAAARVVIADLIYAQNLAISTGTATYVRFDKTNNQYSVIQSPTSSSSTKGTLVTHPITQQNYIQTFGSTSTTSVSSWANVTIDTVALNGADATYANMDTVGFDSMGSPYVFRYSDNTQSDLADGSNIVIKCGTLSTQINIAAATGEITVQ